MCSCQGLGIYDAHYPAHSRRDSTNLQLSLQTHSSIHNNQRSRRQSCPVSEQIIWVVFMLQLFQSFDIGSKNFVGFHIGSYFSQYKRKWLQYTREASKSLGHLRKTYLRSWRIDQLLHRLNDWQQFRKPSWGDSEKNHVSHYRLLGQTFTTVSAKPSFSSLVHTTWTS